MWRGMGADIMIHDDDGPLKHYRSQRLDFTQVKLSREDLSWTLDWSLWEWLPDRRAHNADIGINEWSIDLI